MWSPQFCDYISGCACTGKARVMVGSRLRLWKRNNECYGLTKTADFLHMCGVSLFVCLIKVFSVCEVTVDHTGCDDGVYSAKRTS